MRRFASALASVALATFASAPALADCVPGSGLCASAGASVGLPIPNLQVGGQITIGIPPIVLPGVAPAPQPQPQPQPQVVQVYPQQPPPPVYVYQQPPPRYVYASPPPAWGASRLGLDLRVDGALGSGADRQKSVYGLGGAGIGLRYRLVPHFGVEAGIDLLGGRDYNENKRVEIDGTLGGNIFFNPRSRAQVYLSGGVLVDHAQATDNHGEAPVDLHYNHVGGYAGLGLEMFATRHLSFHLDARGVVRQNVGGNTPEFTDPANGRTTNTSGGLVGSAGMTFYF